MVVVLLVDVVLQGPFEVSEVEPAKHPTTVHFAVEPHPDRKTVSMDVEALVALGLLAQPVGNLCVQLHVDGSCRHDASASMGLLSLSTRPFARKSRSIRTRTYVALGRPS